MNKAGKWILGAVALLFVAVGLALFASMAFVFSIGTASVDVQVEATAYDKETKRPLPRCLLAFEPEPGNRYEHDEQRSDAEGRVRTSARYGYTGSLLWPFDRDRHPRLRFHLGEPPHPDLSREVETWDMTLHFDEPWTRVEVAPRIELRRHRTQVDRDDALGDPQPTGDVVQARVRFEPNGRGGERYRVLLDVSLDAAQAAACQAPSTAAIEARAVQLYAAEKYEEALAAYQEAIRLVPGAAWAHRGAGRCLRQLERRPEAIDANRRAAELAPGDAEIQFAYANSLLNGRHREAAREFAKLTEMEPANPRGFVGLGGALGSLDRCKEALAAYEKARALCRQIDCFDDEDREMQRYCEDEVRGR